LTTPHPITAHSVAHASACTVALTTIAVVVHASSLFLKKKLVMGKLLAPPLIKGESLDGREFQIFSF